MSDYKENDPRAHCVETIRDCNFSPENLIRPYDQVYFYNCTFRFLNMSDMHCFFQCVFNNCTFYYCSIGMGSALLGSEVQLGNNEIYDMTFMNHTEFHYCRVDMSCLYVDLRYLTDAICTNSLVTLTGYEYGEGAERFHHKAACPAEGSFIGYKKARYRLTTDDGYCHYGNAIVTLEIPEHAKRSNAFGTKCRCSEAKVLKIESLPGEADIPKGATVYSDFDPTFTYRVGEVIKPKYFEDRWWVECAPGIHFFHLKENAIDYSI